MRWNPNRTARLAVISAAAALIVGCAGSDTVEPPAELIKLEPRVELDRVWSVNTGGSEEFARLQLTVSTDGDSVYALAGDGDIYAVSLSDGRRRWRAETDLALSGGLGVGQGIGAAGSLEGDVVAVSLSDGSELWRIELGSEIIAAPAVGAGRVVVRTTEGRLVGLDAETGQEVWNIKQESPALTIRGTSYPVIRGGAAFIGFDNGHVLAVNVSDGGVLWENVLVTPSGATSVERIIDIDAPVVVVGEEVFAVSYQGRVGLISANSGQPLWGREMSSYQGLDVDLSRVFVTDSNSHVHAMDRTNGSEVWENGLMRARFLTAPEVHRGLVAVGDFDGYLHLLDADEGVVVGRERVGGGQVSRPLSVGELLVTYTRDGRLMAFRIEEG